MIDNWELLMLSLQQNLENCTDATRNTQSDGMAYGRIRVPVGEDENGKPIVKQISGSNDVERFLNAVQAAYATGYLQTKCPGLFSLQPVEPERELHPLDKVAQEWWNEYLTMKKNLGKLNDGTYNVYSNYLTRHIIDFFGDKPIENIKFINVQEFAFSRVDPRTEDFYAKGTISNILSELRQLFDYAVMKEYIDENPMNKGTIINPSDKKKVREPLTSDELMQVRSAIPQLKQEQERLYLTLLAYLPYRKCEAVGQRWEDIDFDKGTCSVTGDLVVVNGKAVYQEGKAKNKQSLRTMIAPEAMLKALEPYRKQSGFVLNKNGEHLTANGMDALWKSIKKQIPLLEERSITPYCFRHTIASVMYHQTEDIVSVAKQCGHKNTKITQSTYIHDDIAHRRATVEKMERALC